DLGVDRQAKHDGVVEGLFIGHRQGAGHGQVDGAGLGVGLGAKGGAAAGEDLGLGGQLDVDLEADYGFPAHAMPSGALSCQSVTCWYWCARLSIRASLK